jgi:hypothetical protein
MGARRERRRAGRPQYQDYLTTDPGRRRRGLLRWLRKRRRLVSTPLPGGDGWYREGGDGGAAGVREPRRPLPRSPQGAAERPRG